jgi:magnesium transporter
VNAAFEIHNGVAPAPPDSDAPVVVYVAPTPEEVRELIDGLGLNSHDVESALDPDEISRLEQTPERLSIIWKRPQNVTIGPRFRFDVASAGLFMHKDRLVIVMKEDVIPFASPDFEGATSTTDVLLRFLRHTIHHYLAHLKVVKQLTLDLESKISTSMENRYLLQMFALSESLIYYVHAIEANGVVLHRLQGVAERLALTQAQREFLDDIALDNKQCVRQAEIYSSVMSELMDARGSIINNNMSVLLKNLTLINVIFLPLNLLAGIGGMSEYSMMTRGVDWRLAYALCLAGMVVLAWVTWIIIMRAVGQKQRRQAGFGPRRRRP